MAYETEMKAWVDNWDAVEAHLRERLAFNRAFRKEDRYFVSRHAKAQGSGVAEDVRGPSGPMFRLRLDGERAVVTFKAKSVREDIEFNQEQEFYVDDPHAFAAFAQHIGFRQQTQKVKQGLSFSDGDLHVELVEIVGLGRFLEVEFVHENDDPDLHEEAASRIRSVLALAGIPDSHIEPKPYNQLLRQRRERNGQRSGR